MNISCIDRFAEIICKRKKRKRISFDHRSKGHQSYATDAFSDDDSLSLQVVRYDFGRQVDRRRPYARGQRPHEPSHPLFRRNAGGKEG